MNNERITLALSLARFAHKGQKRDGGEEYIKHPMRVASKFSEEDALIAAVLHDVVEDSAVSIDTIESLFGPSVKRYVDNLTKMPGESYDDFIKRALRDDISRMIKIEDIEDNLMTLTPRLERNRKKYKDALVTLKEKDE